MSRFGRFYSHDIVDAVAPRFWGIIESLSFFNRNVWVRDFTRLWYKMVCWQKSMFFFIVYLWQLKVVVSDAKCTWGYRPFVRKNFQAVHKNSWYSPWSCWTVLGWFDRAVPDPHKPISSYSFGSALTIFARECMLLTFLCTHTGYGLLPLGHYCPLILFIQYYLFKMYLFQVLKHFSTHGIPIPENFESGFFLCAYFQ